MVEALEPRLIADIPGNVDLRSVAEEAGARIRAALDAVIAS